jgi:DNA-directed RNA polymerase specialized sigma24 family protein
MRHSSDQDEIIEALPVLANALARRLPRQYKPDVRQEVWYAYLSLREELAGNSVPYLLGAIRHKVIGIFRSRAWSHSHQDRFPHSSYESILELPLQEHEKILPSIDFGEDALLGEIAADRMIATLNGTEKAVAQYLYKDGLSQTEAATILDCHPSYVSKVKDSALGKLRKRFVA